MRRNNSFVQTTWKFQTTWKCTTTLLFLSLLLPGCGPSASDGEAQQLLQKQRQRKLQELSQAKSLDQQISEIQDYLSNGNLALAERMLNPLLISHPDHPELLRASARSQAARGELLGAVQTLGSIETDDPETQSELGWMAVDWLIEAQRYDLAEQQLKQMLPQASDPTRVHRTLASILNNQGRRLEAGEHLQELAKRGAIQEKELLAMITYRSVFIDETLPKPEFAGSADPALLAQARLMHSQGELDQAIQLTRRLREQFPESLPIAAFEGRLYGDAQLDDSLRDWIAAVPEGIEREPEYWSTMGTWLQRQDRHRSAVRCFAEAVRRDPTDRFSYDKLQRSLRYLGDDEAAEAAATRFNQLYETARLAKILGRREGTSQELHRMADLMMQLRRPWESVAWRSIAFSTHGGSDGEREQLAETRQAIVDSQEEEEKFLVCGLELARWPLPTGKEFSTASTNTDSSGAEHSSSIGSTENRLQTRIELHDVAAAVGLDFQYDNGDDNPDDRSRLLHQLTGGGIGAIDYDLDGCPDLYLTQGGGDAFDADGSKPNRLYRNLAGQSWHEVTSATQTGDRGYGQGVEVADLNQDGFPDLLVANVGPNVIYMNNGDGTFTSRALPGDTGTGRWTTSIACGDLSGDHLPEIVEVNYVDDPRALTQRCTPQASSNCNPKRFQAAKDRAWQVTPEGELKPWDGCRNLASERHYGFAAVIADVDGEVGNEIFVANDAGPNLYWVGEAAGDEGERMLQESARIYGCAVGQNGLAKGCMGIAWGDLDRNGRFDLYVTNFWNESADTFLQRDTKLFVPASPALGLYSSSLETVGWGTVAIDLDRNGWLDVAVLNGHVRDDPKIGQPFAMRPQLFRGDEDGFSLVEGRTMEDPYWQEAKLGRTMATLDWNGDLKPDLVTNHLDDPVALLENRSDGGRGLRVELIGTDSERDAVGATVTLIAGDQRWTSWQTGGDGFLCSHQSLVDFGVGDLQRIDRLEVQWPSGHRQTFDNVATDAEYLIIEGQASVYRR